MTDWKKFYNKTASQRDKSDNFKPIKIIGKRSDELIKEVQKHLKNGMRIIDFGCGTGRHLIEIYRTTDKKVKMIGIDNSPGVIKIAKEKAKGIKDVSFLLMDAFKTKFKSNMFDIVMNRLGAPLKSYNEIFRILKKNGLFILFVSDKGDWKEVIGTFGFKESLGLEQLNFIKNAGFKVIKIYKISSTQYYRNIEDLRKTIETIPFKPQLDKKTFYKKFKEYERKYKTYWGIKSSQKRLLIISKK